MKEASDWRVPAVAVGFMYPEGYVRQRIRDDGWQESLDEFLDRDAASISRVLSESGAQIIVEVPFIQPPIYVAIWKIDIGRIPLYLMDTDIETNEPWNRHILAHLYTSDLEQRLRQEIILGIGGSKVLEVLGIGHSIMHLNDGHPAFALLERMRERIVQGMEPEAALQRVRQTTIFTTHTPLLSGHDVFPFPMIEKYFSAYWPALGLDRERFLRLGIHPDDPQAGFNMTALAMRFSNYRNGVSKRHTEITRKMWRSLWPELPPGSIPIDHITNGVHVPTWIEPKMELLFDRYLGEDWRMDHDNPRRWERIDDIPDRELWETHYWLKVKLINAIREWARRRWANDQANSSLILSGGVLLDPSVLTIGFARRFTSYKRADLIFHDLERLKKLVNSRWQPIQIVFAGKAHPSDDEGKRILQRVFNISRDRALAGRIAFVEDYGEQLAQYMVHGADVWLNNPLPPSEASGTSGMKACLNGVPHLSILDGWWIEGFTGRNGWAFGQASNEGHNRDGTDAQALYDVLENEIIPLYYQVSEDGIPEGWVKVMKELIRHNAPLFSTRRMVKEYIDKFYVPALRNA